MKFLGPVLKKNTSNIAISDGVLQTALNSDKLDSQEGSYYLDYNNLTNKPTSMPANGGNSDTVDGLHATDFAPSSHVGATGAAHGVVTTTVDGFMSYGDKVKLNSVATNANNYTHPATHPASMINSLTANTVAISSATGILSASAITTTELSYLDGVTSSIQTQLDGKAPTHTHPYAPDTHVGATGTAHGIATISVNGFMSSTDKSKLDNIASGANNYVHPTDDGNLHVPATGTTNNGRVLKAGSTAGSLLWGTLSASEVGLGNVTNESKATMFASPTFTGTVTVPTPTTTDNSTKAATTAYVKNQGYVTSSGSVASATNSDTVDGLHASDFGQLTADNTWSGVNTFSQEVKADQGVSVGNFTIAYNTTTNSLDFRFIS